MALCVEDVECNPTQTNKLCYANLTSPFDVDPIGCGCNTFYGWVGPDCLELSSSSYITIVLMALTCIFSFLECIALGLVLRKALKKKGCAYSEKLVTTMFILLGAFGAMGWSLTVALSTGVNTGPAIIAEPDQYSDPFSGRYNAFALFFGPIAIGATVLGILNNTILLIDVADRARALSLNQSEFLTRNRVLIHSFQVLCIILAIIAFVFEKGSGGTSILGFVLVVPAVAVIVTYSYGAYRITIVLSNAYLAEKYTPVVKGVRNTAAAVMVSMTLYILAVVSYSSFDTFGGSWKNFTSSDGSFGIGKLCHHFQIIAVMLVCGAVTKFLYDSSFHHQKRVSLANRLSVRPRFSIRPTSSVKTEGMITV